MMKYDWGTNNRRHFEEKRARDEEIFSYPGGGFKDGFKKAAC
jgi:hypothetical protein